MGIGGGFAFDGAQAEALRGVKTRRFQPPIVETQHFRLAVFEEQFAILGTFQRVTQNAGGGLPVKGGMGEEIVGRFGQGMSPDMKKLRAMFGTGALKIRCLTLRHQRAGGFCHLAATCLSRAVKASVKPFRSIASGRPAAGPS